MKEITYTGTIRDYEQFAESHQAERQAKVSQAEDAYEDALAAYRSVVQQRPSDVDMDWTFEYDVDEPIITPDLRRGQTQDEEDRLRLEHENALLSRLARDLLRTIHTTETAAARD